MFKADTVADNKIVVGPFKTLREADAGTGNLQAIVTTVVTIVIEAITIEVMIDGARERLGSMASQPRFGEGCTYGIVMGTVCNSVDTKFLAIAGRQGRPSIFVEPVL